MIRITLVWFIILTAAVSAADLPSRFILPGERSSVSASLDQPRPGLVTNTAIDIVEHNGAIWLATGKGAMFSLDTGRTWQVYDITNGLVSDNLSAIFSAPSGRLWIGSNHDELISEELFSLSDGVSYTENDGDLWTQVDFGSGGLDIPFVWGGNRQVFDISGMRDTEGRDWMMFAAFAGGLLASQDDGQNWRRIFPSSTDSAQFNIPGSVPSLRNRYFSCVADTSRADTVVFWTGTADGVFQYIFARPEGKFFVNRVRAITACDTCGLDNPLALMAGGDYGLARGRAPFGTFTTLFKGDGLPDSSVTALEIINGRLFAGLIEPDLQLSKLVYSDDLGQTYTDITLDVLQDTISDFGVHGDRYYVAAGATGLWQTNDSGLNWTQVLVPAVDPGSAFNAVNGIEVVGDTMRLATDTGYVSLTLAADGTIDSTFVLGFEENLRESRKVLKVASQQFQSDVILWAVSRPANNLLGTSAINRSPDLGQTWTQFGVDSGWYDIAFLNDTGYFVGARGIFTNVDAAIGLDERLDFANSEFDFDNDTGLVVEVIDDQLYFGTTGHLAISFNPDDTTREYVIYEINTDTLRADAVVNYTFANSLFPDPSGNIRVGLTGDFIPAMGIQYRPGDTTLIWASGRPVSGGGNGISVGRFVEEVTDTDDTLTLLRWIGVNTADFAWNYGFNGDTVFAATSNGLIYKDMGAPDYLDIVWDTLEFVDALGNVLLEPGTPTFGAEVIGPDLWVGTADGTVRVNLADFADQQIYLVVDSVTPPDEVYSFPTPFRPNVGEQVDFHFTVEGDAFVTLEIFDFAMNLVATPIDDVFYPTGIYHGTSPGGGAAGATWDGLNDAGDLAAVGMYYFRVSYSTGDERWGKIAVIP